MLMCWRGCVCVCVSVGARGGRTRTARGRGERTGGTHARIDPPQSRRAHLSKRSLAWSAVPRVPPHPPALRPRDVTTATASRRRASLSDMCHLARTTIAIARPVMEGIRRTYTLFERITYPLSFQYFSYYFCMFQFKKNKKKNRI